MGSFMLDCETFDVLGQWEMHRGPQMVEVSRDGKRVYFTNSLYAAWNEQFYPDGVGSWMAKLNASAGYGISFDRNFLVESTDYRVHQVHLEGGDSSSDSYCFP